MTERLNTAEGGTDGVTVTIGNSGGASGNAWDDVTIQATGEFTYEDTHPAHGALGYRCNATGAGAVNIFGEWSLAGTHQFGRIYIWRTNFPTTSIAFVKGVLSNLRKAVITLRASGVIRIQDAGANFLDGVVPLALNSQNRVEYEYIAGVGTGQIIAHVFVGSNFDGNTPDEIITGPTTWDTGASLDGTRFGYADPVTNTSQNGQPTFYDDIALSDEGFPGPAPGAVPRHVFGMEREGFTRG